MSRTRKKPTTEEKRGSEKGKFEKVLMLDCYYYFCLIPSLTINSREEHLLKEHLLKERKRT
jgi:hypothetical protein